MSLQPRSLNKEILSLAIPNVISNISLPLMASIDTALMGNLSINHVAAVGLSSLFFSFMYWNCGFLRMGTTGITAQNFGAKDEVEIGATLGRSSGLAILMSVLFLIVLPLLLPLLYQWFQVEQEVQDFMSSYIYIRLWEIPASIMTISFIGWFFGVQNALYPMIITIAINVVNMGLSYYLVVYSGLEIRGVALGTAIANYLGLFIAIALFFNKYRHYAKKITRSLLLETSQLRRFFDVNRDIALRTILLTSSIVIFFRESSIFGATILAVNTILWQFLNWVSYGVDGFAFAAESIVGKYKGAQSMSVTSKVIRLIFLWSLGLAILYSLIYFIFGPAILGIFSNQTELIEAAKPYLIWVVIFPLVSFMSYIWDGIFVGLTASRSMLLSMISAFSIYLITYLIAKPILGPNAIWLGFILLNFSRGLTQQFMYWSRGFSLR